MLKCPLWQWPRGAGDILICSLGPKCSGDEERSFCIKTPKGASTLHRWSPSGAPGPSPTACHSGRFSFLRPWLSFGVSVHTGTLDFHLAEGTGPLSGLKSLWL